MSTPHFLYLYYFNITINEVGFDWSVGTLLVYEDELIAGLCNVAVCDVNDS
jgi:hypothetical protein